MNFSIITFKLKDIAIVQTHTWFPPKKLIQIPGLFASDFQDLSRTFHDFYGGVRIATIKFLSCKIKTAPST